MKKHFILDKTKLKEGILFCLGIEEHIQDIETKYKNYVVYTGEEYINFYWYYDEVTESIKEKTEYMLYKEGIYKLRDGEKITDDKLIYIEQPSQYHTWNGTEWEVNLNEVKKLKIEEFKRIRDKKISEDLEVEGALFQVRPEDLQKFFLKKIEADLGATKPDNWRLADNTYKEIDFEFIKKILEAYGARQRAIFTQFGVLEYQINNCNSVEEIEAIKWL